MNFSDLNLRLLFRWCLWLRVRVRRGSQTWLQLGLEVSLPLWNTWLGLGQAASSLRWISRSRWTRIRWGQINHILAFLLMRCLLMCPYSYKGVLRLFLRRLTKRPLLKAIAFSLTCVWALWNFPIKRYQDLKWHFWWDHFVELKSSPPQSEYIVMIFIGPRCPWGPIYGSGCLSVQDLCETCAIWWPNL